MNEARIRIPAKEPLRVRVLKNGSGGSGTLNYNALVNKPSIEGHTLQGDSTLKQIGVGDVTPQDIDAIIYG